MSCSICRVDDHDISLHENIAKLAAAEERANALEKNYQALHHDYAQLCHVLAENARLEDVVRRLNGALTTSSENNAALQTLYNQAVQVLKELKARVDLQATPEELESSFTKSTMESPSFPPKRRYSDK